MFFGLPNATPRPSINQYVLVCMCTMHTCILHMHECMCIFTFSEGIKAFFLVFVHIFFSIWKRCFIFFGFFCVWFFPVWCILLPPPPAVHPVAPGAPISRMQIGPAPPCGRRAVGQRGKAPSAGHPGPGPAAAPRRQPGRPGAGGGGGAADAVPRDTAQRPEAGAGVHGPGGGRHPPKCDWIPQKVVS